MFVILCSVMRTVALDQELCVRDMMLNDMKDVVVFLSSQIICHWQSKL